MTQIKLIKNHFLKEKETLKSLAKFISKAEKLSMGEECKKFENSFSNFQKRNYTVMVSNGSSANLGLIQALINLKRLKPGDKVAFSAVTWSTNVMPIIQLGLIPIPVDVDINTLNVSSENFIKTLSKHQDIKAFFITNILGFCSDIDIVQEICNEKKIILIEDNCESLGSEYKEKKLGNFGIASTCSFFVGHHLSTIEGGIITTDDEELYRMTQLIRAHGWNRDLSIDKKDKLTGKHNIDPFYDPFTFYELAYNMRPTEISGFIGNIQMPLLEDSIDKRAQNYAKFSKIIENKSDFYYIYNKSLNRVSNMAFPILSKTKANFLRAKNLFTKANIEIRPIVSGNMVRQPFFIKNVDNVKYNLENSDIIHEFGFYFPNNPELTKNELNIILNLLNSL